MCSTSGIRTCFNTQPPEGGCSSSKLLRNPATVSTHSRLKAADLNWICFWNGGRFQHTAA